MKKRVLLFLLLTSFAVGCSENVQPVVRGPEVVRTNIKKAAEIQVDSRIPAENIDLEVYQNTINPNLSDVTELTELVIKQYEAIRDQDKQAYLDTLNIPGLIGQDNYFKVVSENNPSDRIMRGYIYRIPYILLGINNSPDFDFEDKTKAEESYKTLCEAVDKLSPENAGLIFDNKSSAFTRFLSEDNENIPQNFESEKENYVIDESAYVNFLVSAGKKNDKAPFLKTKLTIKCNNYSYNFDAYLWKNGEEKGCYIYNMQISDNAYSGMTIEDIREAKEEEREYAYEVYQANTRTTAADSAVMQYLKKKKIDFKTALENGDFAMASSPEGLDLSGEKPTAEGDKAIFNAAYKPYGVPKNGIIYIGERFDAETEYIEEPEDEEDIVEKNIESSEDSTEESTAKSKEEDAEIVRNWYIQWHLDDSSDIIGQCPSVYDNKNIKWKEYYIPAPPDMDNNSVSSDKTETSDKPTENGSEATAK